jgi:hypothetical protein
MRAVYSRAKAAFFRKSYQPSQKISDSCYEDFISFVAIPDFN